jgi:hypothetical protein
MLIARLSRAQTTQACKVMFIFQSAYRFTIPKPVIAAFFYTGARPSVSEYPEKIHRFSRAIIQLDEGQDFFAPARCYNGDGNEVVAATENARRQFPVWRLIESGHTW